MGTYTKCPWRKLNTRPVLPDIAVAEQGVLNVRGAAADLTARIEVTHSLLACRLRASEEATDSRRPPSQRLN